MGYLKKEWKYYGEREGGHNFSDRNRTISFELTIKDEMGTKIDFIKWNNNQGYKIARKILKEKYNLDFEDGNR